MFVYAIINIFIDIKKRGEMYAGYISDDLQMMKDLGLADKINNEFAAELKTRIAGAKATDGGVDDQLIQNAVEMPDSEWRAAL